MNKEDILKQIDKTYDMVDIYKEIELNVEFNLTDASLKVYSLMHRRLMNHIKNVFTEENYSIVKYDISESTDKLFKEVFSMNKIIKDINAEDVEDVYNYNIDMLFELVDFDDENMGVNHSLDLRDIERLKKKQGKDLH